MRSSAGRTYFRRIGRWYAFFTAIGLIIFATTVYGVRTDTAGTGVAPSDPFAARLVYALDAVRTHYRANPLPQNWVVGNITGTPATGIEINLHFSPSATSPMHGASAPRPLPAASDVCPGDDHFFKAEERQVIIVRLGDKSGSLAQLACEDR